MIVLKFDRCIGNTFLETSVVGRNDKLIQEPSLQGSSIQSQKLSISEWQWRVMIYLNMGNCSLSYLPVAFWSLRCCTLFTEIYEKQRCDGSVWYRMHCVLKCYQLHIVNIFFNDDVTKRDNFPRYWPVVMEIHQSPLDSRHKGLWRGALMLSLICAWTMDWTNNRDVGDLRRHRAHYDVTVNCQRWWLINVSMFSISRPYFYILLYSKTVYSQNLI